MDIRICFVGDSFINGTGDPECLGWAGRVCAAATGMGLHVTYYNLGVRRETSRDIAARWLPEVSPRLVTGVLGRIVFSFGVNDTTIEDGSARVPEDESLANAEQILTQAKTVVPVLMVGPAPVANPLQNESIGRLSRALQELCGSLGIPYVEVFTPLSRMPIWLSEVASGDGSHPSSGGYRALARLVQESPLWAPWLQHGNLDGAG